jgi:hypothetical protein
MKQGFADKGVPKCNLGTREEKASADRDIGGYH